MRAAESDMVRSDCRRFTSYVIAGWKRWGVKEEELFSNIVLC